APRHLPSFPTRRSSDLATVAVDADHSFDLVEPLIRAALLDRLSFAARELGQPAYLSEVIATAQAVPGVDHVDVEAFAGVGANSRSEEHTSELQSLAYLV